MREDTTELLGIGIYSVPEAARFTGVPSRRIHRWIRGYSFWYKTIKGDMSSSSPAVVDTQLPDIEGKYSVTFQELLEIKAVNSLRQKGVSWPSIRKAVEKAKRILQDPYPISSGKVKILNKKLYAEWEGQDGKPHVEEILTGQYGINDVLKPLLESIDYSSDNRPERWWPMGKNHLIIIDPNRCFGQPITSNNGIPTIILAKTYMAEKDVQRVAWWYDAEAREVQDAVEFERDILRKAA
jgi:uncharacterized protein (DUF433 family)